MKQCITCKEVKPLDCFSIESGKHRGACKDCRRASRRERQHIYNERNKARRLENPEKFKEYKRKYRSKPGIKEAEAECRKAYREKNKDRDRDIKRAWVEKNRDRIKIQSAKKYQDNKVESLRVNREWMKANAERRKEYTRLYRESHKGERAAHQKLRSARKLQATPFWAQIEEIKKLYIDAAKIGGMHVDHIVPLRSNIVCGLHVLANLRIIPKEENEEKSNRWWPDMP